MTHCLHSYILKSSLDGLQYPIQCQWYGTGYCCIIERTGEEKSLRMLSAGTTSHRWSPSTKHRNWTGTLLGQGLQRPRSWDMAGGDCRAFLHLTAFVWIQPRAQEAANPSFIFCDFLKKILFQIFLIRVVESMDVEPMATGSWLPLTGWKFSAMYLGSNLMSRVLQDSENDIALEKRWPI